MEVSTFDQTRVLEEEGKVNFPQQYRAIFYFAILKLM
jgi:hypothetical protein